MSRARRILAAVLCAASITACSASPSTPPEAEVGESDGPISVIDDAHSVADGLEQRQADLESHLQDPFQQP